MSPFGKKAGETEKQNKPLPDQAETDSLDAKRGNDGRTAAATSKRRNSGFGPGEAAVQKRKGRQVGADRRLYRSLELAVCHEVDRAEGPCTSKAVFHRCAIRPRLRHGPAMSRHPGIARFLPQFMLDALRGTDRRCRLGGEQGQQHHRSRCREKPSRARMEKSAHYCFRIRRYRGRVPVKESWARSLMLLTGPIPCGHNKKEASFPASRAPEA